MQADLFLGDLEDPAVGEYVPTPRWVVQVEGVVGADGVWIDGAWVRRW